MIHSILLAIATAISGVYDNLDYGNPGGDVQVLDSPGFAIGYSEKFGQPLWVCYRLTCFEATNNITRRADKFIPDLRLGEQAHLSSEYSNSGYDRGHIAPAADMHWSTNTMYDSFMMSNMSPQRPMFNRGIWRELESWVRNQAVIDDGLIVYSGPIIINATNRIGKGIVVPDGYYKVIYAEKQKRMIAFMLKNEASTNRLGHFACSVNDVEKATGLDFFKKLGWWAEFWGEMKCDPEAWGLESERK